MDIEYEQHNVSFQVDGDMLKVLASATVMVTEELFETNTIWTFRLGMSILRRIIRLFELADWHLMAIR